MKKMSLIVGCAAALLLAPAACSSDVVNTTPDPTGSGGKGGDVGNNLGGGGSGGSGGSGGAALTCEGQTFPNECERACCKLGTECNIPNACALMQSLLKIKCGEPQAECVGKCVLVADCSDILAVASGGTPSAATQACLAPCFDECTRCVGTSCQAPLAACQSESSGKCSTFLSCSQSCTSDEVCIAKCASDNPSTETTALVACIGSNCPGPCYGAGGGGGTGGTGGAGGNPGK